MSEEITNEYVLEKAKQNVEIDPIIEIQGKRVHLLQNAINTKTIPDPELSDAWIINHNAREEVWKFLFVVCASDDMRVYLKPIFMLKEFEKNYEPIIEFMGAIFDGYIQMEHFIEKTPLINRVNTFITQYSGERDRLKYRSEKQFTFQKVFDFYYSRNRTIKPRMNAFSLAGYSYPRIEIHFPNYKRAFILARNLMQRAYDKNWLTREYVDTSYLCHHCSSAFLSFRETCPKCGYHDLKVRDIIHHFRCATVASEEDFNYNGHLICPKCKTTLKNKGVDYDTPGKLFYCGNPRCNHKFQNPPISVKCISCGTEQEASELHVQKIYEYELTESGILAGLSQRSE